jgi:heptosyltransferase-1
VCLRLGLAAGQPGRLSLQIAASTVRYNQAKQLGEAQRHGTSSWQSITVPSAFPIRAQARARVASRAVRLLIVKTSSLGDVIHALPLATDLAAQSRSSQGQSGIEIDWVLEEAFAPVVRLHPAVRRAIPVALRRWRKAPLAGDTWVEVGAARRSLREGGYDLVIDCQGLIKSAVVARWAGAPVVGPDAASAREPLAAMLYQRPVAVDRTLHAIARNRAIGAAALGYTASGAASFGLVAPAVPPELQDVTRTPYAVLLTNASRPTKLWPDERWRAVEASFAQRGWRSLLFWGTVDEGDRTRARAQGMQAATVMPRLGLESVAAVLAGAQMVVGLDTGLSHLAAALDVPTVGLFCDYDPQLVGVAGARCVSLGGVDVQPPVAQVLAAVDQVLAT